MDFVESLDKNEVSIKITKTHFNKILKNFTNYIIKQRIKEVFKHEIKADIVINFDFESFKNKSIKKIGFKINQISFNISKEKDLDILNLSMDFTNILEDELKKFNFSFLNKIIENSIFIPD